MTHEIIIGGETRLIRCDMNVLEQIEDEFGSIEKIVEKRNIKAAKFLAAAMINEHNYCAGIPDRVTPEKIGAEMTPQEYAAVWQGVIECFIDCVTVKKN